MYKFTKNISEDLLYHSRQPDKSPHRWTNLTINVKICPCLNTKIEKSGVFMIYRNMKPELINMAKKMPVIGILGPRQSGKTTLAQEVFKKHKYVSLEDANTQLLAKSDQYTFFDNLHNEHGIIIDEIQNVPELLSYIQVYSDKHGKDGYFVITGSQNILVNKAITQSLAGRIAIFTLLPLSVNELRKEKLISNSVNELIYKGQYPRIYDKHLDSKKFYPNYINTYVERDVRSLRNIENLSLFKTFIGLCAGRIGQILNITSLADDCGISVITANSWLSILEASYIIFLLQPYYKNFGKRLIKSPKIYFYDTGLACSILKITSEEQLHTHYLRGGLFENLILSDIKKQFYNISLPPPMYFWRDKSKNEIDCILEQANNLIPIEIKASKMMAKNHFDKIRYLYDLSESKENNGIVVYAGDQNYKLKHGQILSWSSADQIIKKFKL